MSQTILPENTPLYLRAKQAILDLILKAMNQGVLEDKKLPPEEELCQKLGVSRPTVREALMALSREGVITKKHGTGNLIHPSALASRIRVDTYTDYLSMLEGKGYEADLQCSVVRPPTEEEVRLLESCGGELGQGLFQKRQYTADGVPAILCYSFLSATSNKYTGSLAETDKKFAVFVEKFSGEELAHAMSRIQPTVAVAHVANFFHLKEGAPILRLTEGHYGIHDSLLAETVAYFNPEMMDLSILRKW